MFSILNDLFTTLIRYFVRIEVALVYPALKKSTLFETDVLGRPNYGACTFYVVGANHTVHFMSKISMAEKASRRTITGKCMQMILASVFMLVIQF